MDYLTYTERLNYLLEMIEKGQLLSLKQASEKFECSERTIQRMINELRGQGYHIKYSRRNMIYFIYNSKRTKFAPSSLYICTIFNKSVFLNPNSKKI